MESVAIIIISFYLILYLWNKYDLSKSKHVYLKSQIDENYYYVQKKFIDHQEACNLLAQIKLNLDKLIDHLSKNYPKDNRTIKILNRFDTTNIVENDENTKFTSFTQNKGEKMVFCLRARDEYAQLHSLNLMMFVAIHELGHVASDSVGHNQEFWENFAFLLKESVKIKIWKYIDFKKNPATYCGMKITNSVI
jgi:hypothetical protein